MTATREQIRSALSEPECAEEVSRAGESQPCDKPAVAVRDHETGVYPVCAYHSRRPMVPLADVAGLLADDLPDPDEPGVGESWTPLHEPRRGAPEVMCTSCGSADPRVEKVARAFYEYDGYTTDWAWIATDPGSDYMRYAEAAVAALGEPDGFIVTALHPVRFFPAVLTDYDAARRIAAMVAETTSGTGVYEIRLITPASLSLDRGDGQTHHVTKGADGCTGPDGGAL